MILVDTSIWIDHLRADNSALADLLENGRVSTHDFVIGELACGNPNVEVTGAARLYRAASGGPQGYAARVA